MAKNTKKAKCKNCSPDVAGVTFDADMDWDEKTEEWVKVWKCRNCWMNTPRRYNKVSTKLTKQAVMAMFRFYAAARELVAIGNGEVRFTRDVTIKHVCRGTYAMSFSIAPAESKPGTAGEYLTTKRFQVFVGPRGKLSNPDTKSTKLHDVLYASIV